mmetsp:Transcript_21755/g.85008  ORF Transcript_21755/g.85008 Transcript_21755/m.85008 type:complete len:691 (-) Transcript_21755:275-2347(-)
MRKMGCRNAYCQGDRLQDDRGRPALHAHGGQGRRACAHPLGFGHSLPVRRAAPHLQERLGGQAVHQRPRLRHGQGPRRGDGELDARQGAGGLRRRRGHRRARRRGDGQEPAQHHRLVHGPDPAHHRQRDRPRLLHPAARARQHRRVGRRREHLPRPRQRAGRDRRRPQSRLAAGLLRRRRRRVQALREGLGRRLRVDQEAVRTGHDDQARHDGVALGRRRAREERADRPGQQPARPVLLGPCAELADPRSRDEAGDGQARPAGRDRPLPERHRRDGGDARQARGPEPQPRGLPAAGDDAVRDQRFLHRVEPLAAVAREGHRAAVGEPHRPHDHVPAGAEAGLRQGADQELQAAAGQGHGRAAAGGHPARDQPQRLDHRLHRPEPGAPEGPHAQHERLRREDAQGQGRRRQGDRLQPRRRLLRPALALLRHAGDEAPGLAQPLRHLQACDGGRRQLPRELRRRQGRRQPAGRGRLVFEGRRHHHRLPRVRPCAAEEARLVGRPDRGREEGRRGQELEDRSVGRDHPRGDEAARLPPVRQRQGARRRVELPRPDPEPPRAAVLDAAGPGRQVPDPRRQEGLLAPADAVQDGAGRQQGHRQAVPADHELGPSGRVRGRRRGNPLQPLPRRAAAGDVRRDQPGRRQRPRHPQRRGRVGVDADRRAHQGPGHGHRAGRPRDRVAAVPLLRSLAGR